MFRLLDLPAPKHPLIAFLDFSRSPFKKDFPSYKVICDFYQISFKSEESGSLRYGKQTYDYQEGSLVYLAPKQVVEYPEFKNSNIDHGWVLCFHPDLVRSFSLDQKMKDYEFFSYHTNEALHISDKEKTIIDSIIAKIEMELDSNLDDFSEELIATNLELLLNYSKRFYNRQFITRKRFNSGIITQFTNLLEAYFADDLQVKLGVPTLEYFSSKLNYSTNYLNELIKKGTDKSMLEHIHYQVIELAKSKLLNSEKSVSEIAFELGFEYSQYFCRLFKKKTGMTPGEYRKAS